jgi:predicted AAA+ superfamily ATPase
MERALKSLVEADLVEKMVFVGGPRQVGKTTLSLSFLPNRSEGHPAYLNWDHPATRRLLLQGGLPSGEDLLVFDEIHKYKGWRNLIKGFYDTNKTRCRFLVTGSARLDHYRKGGDSLQGRYHYHRLHPLSLAELHAAGSAGTLDQLLRYGGFPEPFLAANDRHWKRWQREHISRVVREDLLSLEQVREVGQIELMAQILPDRVGSPLSINNLRGDLDVSFETVDRWIRILENLYFCFRIGPFGFPKIRAVKKEQKLYLWDWSVCEDEGARFENLVASNLLKYCHHAEDTAGDAMELRFLRDATGRELDFIVLKDGKPQFAVECKLGERSLARHIGYYAARTGIPQFYQVHMGSVDAEFSEHRARVLPFSRFSEILGI